MQLKLELAQVKAAVWFPCCESERSLLADKLGVWFRQLALRYELHGCLWLLRITQVNIVIY